MRFRAQNRRASSQRGMAIDVLALTISIAGSLFFTSQLWSTYRQTLAVTNLQVGLSSLVPLRPQIYSYDSYGFIVSEADRIRIARLNSLIALLAGVTPSEVQSDVPSDALYACLVHASSVSPPMNMPIALDFPYHSSNAVPENCSQLDLSSLARAAPNSLHIIIASTTQSTPIMVLEHPLIGRGADSIYMRFSTATSAVHDMSDFDDLVISHQYGNPF